ncbi:hypothetical protein HY3_05345, partial [Hyphomonas pacifica]
MCATAAAAFASAGFVAHAEDGWYSRADVTYSFDGTIDHDPAVQNVPGSMAGDSDANEIWGADAGFGYGFDNGLRLEGVLGYGSGNIDVSGLFNPPATAFSGGSGYLQEASLMLNGLYDFNRQGALQPYVGLGVGFVRANAKANNLVFTNGTQSAAANGFSDTDTGLAYQGLLGLGYKVSDRLMLDVGYRYRVVEDLELAGYNGGIDYDASYT